MSTARVQMPVTLDWFGCATFRLRVGGRTIFLDAYLDRVPSAPAPGITVADVNQCDWIVIGHSHFDHLWGAERIARQTGATIIGSYETVRVMAAEGVPEEQLIAVQGGERIDLGEHVVVTVFPSLHSCVWSHGAMAQSDVVCLGDAGLTWQEQKARFAGLTDHFRALPLEVHEHLAAGRQGERGDGGALVYLFETPSGLLLYQDTSGHWSGILDMMRPDVAILAAAGRGNVDGDPTQGSLAQFVARQAARLRPRRIVLSHHDDWLPGFSVATDIGPIRRELALTVPEAELVEIGYRSPYPIFDQLPDRMDRPAR